MAKICMNKTCRATTTLEWKNGWNLKSGGFATLCHNCGYAYENFVYCETFHLEESGWRECDMCGKRIHCGCIGSKDLHDYLDFGGVGCISCVKSSVANLMRSSLIPSDDTSNRVGALATNKCQAPQSLVVENKVDGITVDWRKPMLLSKNTEIKEPNNPPQILKRNIDASIGPIIREDVKHSNGEAGVGIRNLAEQSIVSSMFFKPKSNDGKLPQAVKDMHESLVQPSLNFSLSTPSGTPNSSLPFCDEAMDRRDQDKVPSFQQGQRTRHILPKPPKNSLNIGSAANKGMNSHTPTARPPPGDSRGRIQLLPRYWPRISDKELQQISGNLKSTIVPLFEKVLSASDAGRIGRLVLPKACAEIYFPPISQSEGVPLKIQDIKGKEWTFQFRFWPNNNSRMYVLEGVTPCIQNMQLQAGDTVIFSRIEPGGNLVMGFRKNSDTDDLQDGKPSALPNGAFSGETSFSGVDKDALILNEKHRSRTTEDSVQQPMLNPEKKKTRNIGSKSKRLLMHSEDAMELRLTWEEAQELLRPAPSVQPTIVMIEDHEFEEYSEPPVFGKKTFFTTLPSGEQEQWAQCDSCLKWRKLPWDVLLPPKWTCWDNLWDSSRCSCSAPNEMIPKELESLIKVRNDVKRRKVMESRDVSQDCEPSGLDALATAAVLGAHEGESGEPSSVGATTKHPRHRPGCSCIVCIQPPSGKGKHKPTCICNVCLTVRRRFKTLMLRRRRQSEREAEAIRGMDDHIRPANVLEANGGSSSLDVALSNVDVNHSGNKRSKPGGTEMEIVAAETGKGRLDLNFDPDPNPNRDKMVEEAEATGMSMTRLVHAASLPLEMYMMRHNNSEFSKFDPSLLLKAAADVDAAAAAAAGERQPSIEDENCSSASSDGQDDDDDDTKGGES